MDTKEQETNNKEFGVEIKLIFLVHILNLKLVTMVGSLFTKK